MIYVFLATGFEEVEALIPVDILRRAGNEVEIVSIEDTRTVVSSHGVSIVADSLFADNNYSDAELVFLPGGLPGSTNLAAYKPLCDLLVKLNSAGEKIAAICAAPAAVLGTLGILGGKRYTCYPGCESMFADETARISGDIVTVDGNITTGEGPAAAFSLGYELVRQLNGYEVAEALKEGMMYKHLVYTHKKNL